VSTIISLDRVSKSFSRHRVLSDVSLAIKEGTTVGIVGANGSGKSVLFKLVCGFVSPDSGQVSVRGRPLGKDRDFPENVGVLINAPGFIGLYSGLQNLRYLAGIRGVIGEQEIRAAMQKVGLDPEDRTKVGALFSRHEAKIGDRAGRHGKPGYPDFGRAFQRPGL